MSQKCNISQSRDIHTSSYWKDIITHVLCISAPPTARPRCWIGLHHPNKLKCAGACSIPHGWQAAYTEWAEMGFCRFEVFDWHSLIKWRVRRCAGVQVFRAILIVLTAFEKSKTKQKSPHRYSLVPKPPLKTEFLASSLHSAATCIHNI